MQQKLDALCKRMRKTRRLSATANPLDQPGAKRRWTRPEPDAEESVALASPESDSEESVAPEPRVRLDIDCLPEDLIAVLHRAHGRRGGQKLRACLPAVAEGAGPGPARRDASQ